MKIIFAGTFEKGCTTLARLNALERFTGYEVNTFDSDPYFAQPLRFKWLNRIDHRLFIGKRFRKSNQDLRCFCAIIKPEVIWVDKGFWIWPSTIKFLKGLGAFLVHYNTDYLKRRRWSSRILDLMLWRTLPFFDLYFTTNMVDYKRLSLRETTQIELTYLGFDHFRFNNIPLSESLMTEWKSDILFVGHHEPHTEDGILALIENGLSVTVYGYGWNKAKATEKLKGHVKYRSLTNEEYQYAIKGAKIGLCFFSVDQRSQTSGRSFEIPACGTFLLAMRSEQHLLCYTEGKEAEFFSNSEELVKKARYYLEHGDIRQAIASKGHQRCIESDYSWNHFMQEDLEKVRQAMGKKVNDIKN